MKNKYYKIIASLIITCFFLFLAIGSGVDVNDEKAVIKDMQGTWIGNSHDGIDAYQFNHYKIEISGNNFKGWLKPAYTNDEPSWSSEPDETGTFSLSPVQGYTNSTSKYRNINFNKVGGGYGDNSLMARTFTNMIIYDDGGGLYVVGWGEMSKK